MIVRLHVFAFVVFCILAQLAPPIVLAGLIVEPSSTSPLFNGSDAEDTIKQVSGLNFNFYSNNISQLFVSENGNLKFQTEPQDFFPSALGSSGIARIAPLWDDFLMSASLNNRIVADVQLIGNQFARLAVTWENMRLQLETIATGTFPNSTRTAQVVIFGVDQQIKGFDFKRNDIAFGYKPHTTGSDFGAELFATVGLNSGPGVFTPLPGTVNGRVQGKIRDSNPRNDDLLAWEPDSFILFRPNAGLTTYTGTKEFFITAVPEPSAAILVIVAFGCLSRVRVRSRSE